MSRVRYPVQPDLPSASPGAGRVAGILDCDKGL